MKSTMKSTMKQRLKNWKQRDMTRLMSLSEDELDIIYGQIMDKPLYSNIVSGEDGARDTLRKVYGYNLSPSNVRTFIQSMRGRQFLSEKQTIKEKVEKINSKVLDIIVDKLDNNMIDVTRVPALTKTITSAQKDLQSISQLENAQNIDVESKTQAIFSFIESLK